MIALFTMNVFLVSAQSKDEVTLVVSADGATKDDATKVALRSAIEQAYGTFVSANTQILNDELVKDEIVTVSNGNIKEYEELASVVLPNGNQSVTLKATVCISKLVSYAKSKGASTEFAGATFAMNLKMYELNKRNERNVLENLLTQLKDLIPLCYDPTLTIAEPEVKENYCNMKFKISYRPNENFLTLYKLVTSTLFGIQIKDSQSVPKGIKTRSISLATLPYVKSIDIRNTDFRELFTKPLEILFSKYFLSFNIVDNTGQKSFIDCDAFISDWQGNVFIRPYGNGHGLFSKVDHLEDRFNLENDVQINHIRYLYFDIEKAIQDKLPKHSLSYTSNSRIDSSTPIIKSIGGLLSKKERQKAKEQRQYEKQKVEERREEAIKNAVERANEERDKYAAHITIDFKIPTTEISKYSTFELSKIE